MRRRTLAVREKQRPERERIGGVERALTVASARWIRGGSPWVVFFLEEHEHKDNGPVLPLCGRTGGVDGRRRMAARPPLVVLLLPAVLLLLLRPSPSMVATPAWKTGGVGGVG